MLAGGLEPWIFMTFHSEMGNSSSQLTKSMIFQRGRVGIPPTSIIPPFVRYIIPLESILYSIKRYTTIIYICGHPPMIYLAFYLVCPCYIYI